MKFVSFDRGDPRFGMNGLTRPELYSLSALQKTRVKQRLRRDCKSFKKSSNKQIANRFDLLLLIHIH